MSHFWPQPSPPDLAGISRGVVRPTRSASPGEGAAWWPGSLFLSLSFRVSAKIWRHGIHSRQLRASPTEHAPMPGCFWSPAPAPSELGCGARRREEGGGRRRRGGGAWRGGGSRACASCSRDPRFSMGFPICSRDLPERVAAATGLARARSRRDLSGPELHWKKKKRAREPYPETA